MRQAMDLGADVAGGIPWIEYTDADIREHVKVIFDLAEQYDKDVSMLVDDAGDPGLRSLECMALETIQRDASAGRLRTTPGRWHCIPLPISRN